MSLHNPFTRPDSLKLGYAETTGYWIKSYSLACHVELFVGTAESAARIMQANGVRHFDYDDSMFDNPDATGEFIDAAKAVGFEV